MDTRPYIVIKIMGGLGNQLSQYAFGLHCAMLLRCELKLDISDYVHYKLHAYGLGDFAIKASIATDAESRHAKETAYIREKSLVYTPDIYQLLRAGCYLEGYWGDFRYSLPIRAEMLRELRITTPMTDKDEQIAAEIAASTSVFLHVRRKDYVGNPNYILLNREYYQSAIDYLQNRLKTPRFFIFSDDIEWVRQNLDIHGNITFVNHNNAASNYQDLRLMSLCQHQIVANSSFSFWGAYLANHPESFTIAPGQYFAHNAPWIVANYGKVNQPVYPYWWHTVPVYSRLSQAATLTGRLPGGVARQSTICVGVWNCYAELNEKETMFSATHAQQDADHFAVIRKLQHYGNENGIAFHAPNYFASLETLDALLFFDIPNFADPYVTRLMALDIPKYLCLYESELIGPVNWDTNLHSLFDQIFVWKDSWVDGRKYHKFNFAFDPNLSFRNTAHPLTFSRKKLCTLIAGYKFAQIPGELYSARVQAIRWFEKNHPEDFDFYGTHWPTEEFSSYRGPVEHKLLTLSQYRFALCFENFSTAPGYITEKILDCFRAGVVPIYWGAPNITQWIPAECFIDMRDYGDYEALYQYLTHISAERYQIFLNHIQQFLESEQSFIFTGDYFIATLTSKIATRYNRQRQQHAQIAVVLYVNEMQANLLATVRSVLAQQGVDNVELIVIDNSQQDETEQTLLQPDIVGRVRYHKYQHKAGQVLGRQLAYQLTDADYIAMIAPGETWPSDQLASLLNCLDSQPAAVLAYITSTAHEVSPFVSMVAALLSDTALPILSGLLRRKTLEKAGMSLNAGEWMELDFYATLAQQGLSFIPCQGNISRSHSSPVGIDEQMLSLRLDRLAVLLPGWQESHAIDCLFGSSDKLVAVFQEGLNFYGALPAVCAKFEALIHQLQGSNHAQYLPKLNEPFPVRSTYAKGDLLLSLVLIIDDEPIRLEAILANLQQQNCRNFELIVINLSDAPHEYAVQRAGFPVLYIVKPEGSSYQKALESTNKIARGQYLFLIDNTACYPINYFYLVGENLQS